MIVILHFHSISVIKEKIVYLLTSLHGCTTNWPMKPEVLWLSIGGFCSRSFRVLHTNANIYQPDYRALFTLGLSADKVCLKLKQHSIKAQTQGEFYCLKMHWSLNELSTKKMCKKSNINCGITRYCVFYLDYYIYCLFFATHQYHPRPLRVVVMGWLSNTSVLITLILFLCRIP